MTEILSASDPTKDEWFGLWGMVRASCEAKRYQAARFIDPSFTAAIGKEIRRLDQKGGPEHRARVVAAALAFGEYEIRYLEETLADARAAVELLRKPHANFMRTALRVVSPSG